MTNLKTVYNKLAIALKIFEHIQSKFSNLSAILASVAINSSDLTDAVMFSFELPVIRSSCYCWSDSSLINISLLFYYFLVVIKS